MKKQRKEALDKNGICLNYKGIHINYISNGFGFILKEIAILVKTANDVDSNILKVKKSLLEDLAILKWKTTNETSPEVLISTWEEFKERNGQYPNFSIFINGTKFNVSKIRLSFNEILRMAKVPKKDYSNYYIVVGDDEDSSGISIDIENNLKIEVKRY